MLPAETDVVKHAQQLLVVVFHQICRAETTCTTNVSTNTRPAEADVVKHAQQLLVVVFYQVFRADVAVGVQLLVSYTCVKIVK